MSAELLSALGGAVVAFGGSHLLQRSRFRREDLQSAREGLAATRALLYLLRRTRGDVDRALASGTRPAYIPFPVEGWSDLTLPLMAAMEPDAMDDVVNAFDRFEVVNRVLASYEGPVVSLEPPEAEGAEDGVSLRPSFELLGRSIEQVQPILEQLEAEYLERDERLAHPLKHCLERLRSSWRTRRG